MASLRQPIHAFLLVCDFFGRGLQYFDKIETRNGAPDSEPRNDRSFGRTENAFLLIHNSTHSHEAGHDQPTLF